MSWSLGWIFLKDDWVEYGSVVRFWVVLGESWDVVIDILSSIVVFLILFNVKFIVDLLIGVI